MSGPDIFISYSREDRDVARHFAESFADEGFTVWWDAALHSGETFDEVIESELRAAKAVVVLWSPRSVTSRWVRAEATLADRRKTFAPVIIEPCDRPIIFELTHTVDLSHWGGDGSDPYWQAFLEDLRRLVGRVKAGDRSSPRSSSRFVPKQPRPAQALSQRFSSGAEPAERSSPRSRADNLMFARPSLRDALRKPQQEPVEPDKSVESRFHTGSDRSEPLTLEEVHCLEVTEGDKLEQRYVVSPMGLKIGRTAPADVVLADSRVSRAHCRVELLDNQLQVSDLNSTNGTYIDGERIVGSTILEVGSVLRVGTVSFKHELRTRADV